MSNFLISNTVVPRYGADFSPQKTPGNGVVYTYSAGMSLTFFDLFANDTITIQNVSGAPNIRLPSASDIILLFSNPSVGSIKKLIIIVDNTCFLISPDTNPATNVISTPEQLQTGINELTIHIRDPTLQTIFVAGSAASINIQATNIGGLASIPHPNVFQLDFGNSLVARTLSSVYITPANNQIGLTEVACTSMAGVTVLNFDTVANYKALFSGTPNLPFTYEFFINIRNGANITLTSTAGSNININGNVAPTSTPLNNDRLYRISFTFNAAGNKMDVNTSSVGILTNI